MKQYFDDFIKKMNKDVRFKDINGFTKEGNRKVYLNGQELEEKIIKISLYLNIDKFYPEVISFKVSYIVELNKTYIGLSHIANNIEIDGLDYLSITGYMYSEIQKKFLNMKYIEGYSNLKAISENKIYMI